MRAPTADAALRAEAAEDGAASAAPAAVDDGDEDAMSGSANVLSKMQATGRQNSFDSQDKPGEKGDHHQ